MKIDDPTKPEFASWDSFSCFARRIRHSRRYIFTLEQDAFLATVRATNRGRDVYLPAGSIFYRAQRGIDWRDSKDENGDVYGEQPVGYDAARMKPRPRQATEGRANPAGIPVLYLGTTEQTAISEVRPWVGGEVSVAQLSTVRNLKAVNLSLGHGQSSLNVVGLNHILEGTPVSAEIKEKAVWVEIDNAFSRPITASDDEADYVPTQILAELFKDSGYDAIIYKSQFGEKGFNIVVFHPEDADVINCAPYEVSGIEVSYKEIGNRWFSPKTSK